MSQGPLHAAAVSLFQYNPATQGYEGKGQVGAAITGNAQTGAYKLVCYSDQQTYLCTATITSNNDTGVKFQMKQSDNYTNFKDDNGQQWSLYFSEEEKGVLFAMNVALAMYGCSGMPAHTITTLDLSTPKGADDVDVGDHVGVKFNGYYLGNENGLPKLSYQYDSNNMSKHTYKFQIPSSNTNLSPGMKGFEGLVCGMSEGARRVVVVPGNCRRGIQQGGDGPLIIMVDVRKVKKGAPQGNPMQQQQQQPQQQQQQQQQQQATFQDYQMQQQVQQQPVLAIQQTGQPIQQQVVPVAQQPQIVQQVAQPIAPTPAPTPAAAPAAPTPPGLTSEQLKTVNDTSSNVTALVSNVNEVSQKIDLLAADFKMAQKQQKPTTLTAAQIQHSVSAMIDENKQLKDEVRAKDDMIKTLENRALDLEKKVDKFAQSAHTLMEEKKSAATSVSDTRLEMDRRILKLQEEVQRATSERDDSQRHLATVKKLLDLSEDEIRKLRGETEITRVQSENTKMKLSHAEDSFRTEKEARKLSDEKVLALSAQLAEARDENARKDAHLAEKLRKIEADRNHFNNLMEEERSHAEKEMSTLRDEMLTDLQARERRFNLEKERVSEDQFSRGIDQGRDDGMQEARAKYDEELSKFKAASMEIEHNIRNQLAQVQVEKDSLISEVDGQKAVISDLETQVSTANDNITLLRTELEMCNEKYSNETVKLQAEQESLISRCTTITGQYEAELDRSAKAQTAADQLEEKLGEMEIRWKSSLSSLTKDVVPKESLGEIVKSIFAGEAPDLSFEENASLYPQTVSKSDVPPATNQEDDDWSEIASKKDTDSAKKDSEISDDIVKVDKPKEEHTDPATDDVEDKKEQKDDSDDDTKSTASSKSSKSSASSDKEKEADDAEVEDKKEQKDDSDDDTKSTASSKSSASSDKEEDKKEEAEKKADSDDSDAEDEKEESPAEEKQPEDDAATEEAPKAEDEEKPSEQGDVSNKSEDGSSTTKSDPEEGADDAASDEGDVAPNPSKEDDDAVTEEEQPAPKDEVASESGDVAPAPKDDEATEEDTPTPKDDDEATEEDKPAPKDDDSSTQEEEKAAPKDDDETTEEDKPAPKDDTATEEEQQPAPKDEGSDSESEQDLPVPQSDAAKQENEDDDTLPDPEEQLPVPPPVSKPPAKKATFFDSSSDSDSSFDAAPAKPSPKAQKPSFFDSDSDSD